MPALGWVCVNVVWGLRPGTDLRRWQFFVKNHNLKKGGGSPGDSNCPGEIMEFLKFHSKQSEDKRQNSLIEHFLEQLLCTGHYSRQRDTTV